jgi:intracellular multiplication protein IcmE
MSDAASGVLARFRFHLPKLPAGRVFNHSGSAGPRRLAAIMLVGASTLAVVLGVVFMGRQQPRLSQDARLMRMDPLPGGLHSTPEQDALGLAANDQEAQAALRKGSSYTPPMAPSQPSSALPPHVDLPVPAAPAPSQPVFVGRAPRPLPRLYTPPADATFPAVDQQGQPLYSKQIGDMFSQWGGRVPRTDVIMPPSQGDAGDPPDTSAPSGAGLSSRARSAASAALPVSTRAADQGDILVPAGRGVYAHPVLALSSDQSSPVVLQADSGPLAGDRMIGTFAKQANRLIIHVSTIIHNGENISCDGVVTAPDTMEASVASRVDEHYVSRFLLPAAAAFVNGLGQAIETTSNSVAVLSPLGGATTTNHLNIQQQLGVGAGAAAAQVGQTLNQEAPKGPTVSLEANVAVGVMFLSNVTSHHGE